MRRVAITGMGCVTPYGPGLDRFWQGLIAGRSAITPLTAFDPTPYGTRIAGQVRGFEPRDYLSQREISGSARCVQLALAAARMAIDHARLPIAGMDTSRIGVFVGSSIGTFEYAAENHAIFLEKGIRRVHPLFPAQSYSGIVATQLGISLEIRGPAICISTACTSSTDAIGLAWLQIQGGLLDRAIVGGSDAPITPLLFASFDRLGVMSRHNEHPEAASRPFAHSRDGFVMSEGAGICILEAEDAARERGAPIFAELAGYGATSDGFHSFSPLPTGDEGARAIHQALAAGSIDPATVDYVSAHAIGSRPNDPIEIEIINRVFGERAPLVPISAVKSMIGHTMGASGVLELIGCVQTLQTGCIPPTINLMEEDLLSGLDLVPNHARRAEVHVALAPTFGFGSRNGVLALRHYES